MCASLLEPTSGTREESRVGLGPKRVDVDELFPSIVDHHQRPVGIALVYRKENEIALEHPSNGLILCGDESFQAGVSIRLSSGPAHAAMNDYTHLFEPEPQKANIGGLGKLVAKAVHEYPVKGRAEVAAC